MGPDLESTMSVVPVPPVNPVPPSPVSKPKFITKSVAFSDVAISGALQDADNAGYSLIASYSRPGDQWFAIFQKNSHR